MGLDLRCWLGFLQRKSFFLNGVFKEALSLSCFKKIIQEIIKLPFLSSCKSSIHGLLLPIYLLSMYWKISQCKNYSLRIMKMLLFMYLLMFVFCSCLISKFVYRCFRVVIYKLTNSTLVSGTPLSSPIEFTVNSTVGFFF